jgi:hypothetical protein
MAAGDFGARKRAIRDANRMARSQPLQRRVALAGVVPRAAAFGMMAEVAVPHLRRPQMRSRQAAPKPRHWSDVRWARGLGIRGRPMKVDGDVVRCEQAPKGSAGTSQPRWSRPRFSRNWHARASGDRHPTNSVSSSLPGRRTPTPVGTILFWARPDRSAPAANSSGWLLFVRYRSSEAEQFERHRLGRGQRKSVLRGATSAYCRHSRRERLGVRPGAGRDQVHPRLATSLEDDQRHQQVGVSRNLLVAHEDVGVPRPDGLDLDILARIIHQELAGTEQTVEIV